MKLPLSLLAAVLLASACGGAPPGVVTAPSLADLRSAARASGDGEMVGQWELAEMLAPGGTADGAGAAAKRLASIDHAGLWGSLAPAVEREAHGDPVASAEAYFATLTAAAGSPSGDAPLVGWFASRHLLGLRASVADLYTKHRWLRGAALAARQPRLARGGRARGLARGGGLRQGHAHR